MIFHSKYRAISMLSVTPASVSKMYALAAFIFAVFIIAPVRKLFCSCSPSAVRRFIIAVVVDALDAMFWRSLSPHIGEKVFEYMPALTNRNSTPAVMSKVSIFRIFTALKHHGPRIVFRRMRVALSVCAHILFILTLLLSADTAFSQNASPLGGVGSLQFYDNSGALLSNGVVYIYVAGTSTQATVYVDSTGTTIQPNPVTFGSGARAGIWLANGTFVKVVLCTQNDGAFCAANDILFTADQVPIGSSGGGGGGSPFTGIFISSTASPATSGTLRLASGDSICWRNAAGSANLCFSKNSNDILSWGGGSFQLPEIAAPTCGLAGNDCFWADNTAHRFKSISNGGTAAQFVLSGNDIGTTDQVLGIHWGATQQTFGSTAATTGQVIEFNGTNLVPINTTPNSAFTTSPAIIFTTVQSGTTSYSATMVTAPASAATYRFSGHLHVITIGASCTTNTSAALTLGFTDTAGGGAVNETMPVEVNASVTGSFVIINNGALGNLTHVVGRTFRNASGANVSYTLTITPGTGCSPAPKIEIDPVLEQLTAN